MSVPLSAEALLRGRGLRVTPQRQGVLSVFLRQPGLHWTAEQVRDQLLGAMPGLARGTTYKVLNELVRAGLCEELPTLEDVSLFGLRLAPHHHFVCQQCGRWFDVEADGTDHLRMIQHPPGARVEQVEVLFRGHCPECARTSAGVP